MKRIAILGSTGSIGQSALAVVDAHPDRSAGGRRWPPARTPSCWPSRSRAIGRASSAMASGAAVDRLQRSSVRRCGVLAGRARRPGRGRVASRRRPRAVRVVRHRRARSGAAHRAHGCDVVDGGRQDDRAGQQGSAGHGRRHRHRAARRRRAILPVDSEHNAIHQCLHGRDRGRAEAAGADRVGRTVPRPLARPNSQTVTADDALQHPTWRMGRKITIDSATLMNKGLEVIEAHWLFGVAAGSDRRRRSIRSRSCTRWSSSSTARSSRSSASPTCGCRFSTRSRIPSAGRRRCRRSIWRAAGRLEFEAPDTAAFPCLRLAYRALEAERSLPVVLNAANEVAVARFSRDGSAFHRHCAR